VLYFDAYTHIRIYETNAMHHKLQHFPRPINKLQMHSTTIDHKTHSRCKPPSCWLCPKYKKIRSQKWEKTDSCFSTNSSTYTDDTLSYILHRLKLPGHISRSNFAKLFSLSYYVLLSYQSFIRSILPYNATWYDAIISDSDKKRWRPTFYEIKIEWMETKSSV